MFSYDLLLLLLQSFIKAWRAWDKKHSSENNPIEGFPKHQLYAVFAMANCGRDLEGYSLQGFDEAHAMMPQVSLLLLQGASKH
jgi:hypothetical protein